VDYAEHIAEVERETARIAAALSKGSLDARVPTCPDWTLADLAKHIGEFTGLWTHVVCEGTGREKTPYRDMPAEEDLGAWYGELAGYLVEVLRETPDGTEVWTWMPNDQSVRFVARRGANELAVHRVDVQLAAGLAHDPIEPALAADGIEEMFVMRAAWDQEPVAGNGESLHLHGTDRGDEWAITIHPDRLEVQREHAKSDLALRGTVSDLELFLYQRPPHGEIERIGNESVLDAWYRAFTFG
jgi:uncharacterized protein (TIGR03083 family)